MFKQSLVLALFVASASSQAAGVADFKVAQAHLAAIQKITAKSIQTGKFDIFAQKAIKDRQLALRTIFNNNRADAVAYDAKIASVIGQSPVAAVDANLKSINTIIDSNKLSAKAKAEQLNTLAADASKTLGLVETASRAF